MKQKSKYQDLTKDRVFKAFLPLPDKKSVKSVRLIEDKKTAKKDKNQRPDLSLKDSALYPLFVKEKQAVALNMLKKSADINFISEVTGLAVEEINKLKKRC